MLPAAVAVGIKSQIDGPGGVAELVELVRIEMGSQGAGNVVKPGLPKYGAIEQPLDQNHFRILSDSRPGIQATFSAWQEAVRWCRSRKAAAIKIAFQWKDNPAHVSVVSL